MVTLTQDQLRTLTIHAGRIASDMRSQGDEIGLPTIFDRGSTVYVRKDQRGRYSLSSDYRKTWIGVPDKFAAIDRYTVLRISEA